MADLGLFLKIVDLRTSDTSDTSLTEEFLQRDFVLVKGPTI